jgi:DMSO/TMAO reductase YedYZ heme-binding membrane subunit
MDDTWTYLTRASGIVATALVALSFIWGFLFAARATGERRRPNWWLDLHNYLGGLAFVLMVVHVVAAYLDSLSGIGLAQIFIPGTAEGWEWGITWGVLATYVFAAVVFSSWPRKRLSRRRWLLVHLLSIPATFMVAAHAWMVGESRGGWWFSALLALLAGAIVYPAVIRVASVSAKRRQRRERAARPARELVAS